MSRKWVQTLENTNKEKLIEDINKLMEKSDDWSLVTIDSQEVRSLGVGVFNYIAWLEYDRT